MRAQWREMHEKKGMMRKTVYSSGAAWQWHRSALWLSSIMGLVTTLDMDGGTFKTRGFSLFTSLAPHSLTSLLSFRSVCSLLHPLSVSIHFSSPLSPLHLHRDQALGKMSCILYESSICLVGTARTQSVYLCHSGPQCSTAAIVNQNELYTIKDDVMWQN